MLAAEVRPVLREETRFGLTALGGSSFTAYISSFDSLRLQSLLAFYSRSGLPIFVSYYLIYEFLSLNSSFSYVLLFDISVGKLNVLPKWNALGALDIA